MKKDAEREYGRKFLFSLSLGVPLMYLAMAENLGFPLPAFLSGKWGVFAQFALASSILWFGRDFFIRGIPSLIKTKAANMDTLVSLGVGSAYLYSVYVSLNIFFNPCCLSAHLYYEAAGMLVTFILLGKYLETRTKKKTGAAIEKLISLKPRKALLLENGEEREVDAGTLKKGDTVILKPGMIAPADGTVAEGESHIDESMISGESLPVYKKKGDSVVGGTLNIDGNIKVAIEKTGSETALARIIKLVEEAQSGKAPVQDFADKLAAYFVPAVISVAAGAALFWLFSGKEFEFALSVFVAVLVISCPCALGLATPTAIMRASGLGAESGMLFKSAESFQRAYETDIVVFDKTGTLTEGRPEAGEIKTFGGFSEAEVLKLAASCEVLSEHPIAGAIVEKCRKAGIETAKAENFRAAGGKGAAALVGGNKIVVGNEAMMADENIKIGGDEKKAYEEALEKGKTAFFAARGGKIIGVIPIADRLKPHAREAVEKLKEAGKEVVMLTGDNKKTADYVAGLCGIEKVIAGVLPEGKNDAIKRMKESGKKVAMVGDGINDAPALSLADVAVVFSHASDISVDAGDIVVIKDDLRMVPLVFELSEAAVRKIRQNLFWALFYNLLAIPAAAGLLYSAFGILLNPMIAGAAMSMSSVSVVMNSLSMKLRNRF